MVEDRERDEGLQALGFENERALIAAQSEANRLRHSWEAGPDIEDAIDRLVELQVPPPRNARGDRAKLRYSRDMTAVMMVIDGHTAFRDEQFSLVSQDGFGGKRPKWICTISGDDWEAEGTASAGEGPAIAICRALLAFDDDDV